MDNKWRVGEQDRRQRQQVGSLGGSAGEQNAGEGVLPRSESKWREVYSEEGTMLVNKAQKERLKEMSIVS